MRNNKLNKNFKRLLAVSLGACCASTIMVNAAEQNHINQNEENQNDEIQNEVATDIQTMLIGITQQCRKAMWDRLNEKTDAKFTYNTSQGTPFDFSFVSWCDATNDSFPFLLLVCQDNNQNNIKLMMIKDDEDKIYILPYDEQHAKTQHAKNITQYINNNSNIDITKFERDCWKNEVQIYQYVVNLLKICIHQNEYDVGFFQKAKNWWGQLSIQQQVSLTVAALPVTGIVIQKVF